MSYGARRVRVALCVVRRDDGALLVARRLRRGQAATLLPAAGRRDRVRRTAAEAARRELSEEIGAEVTDLRLITTLENLFTYRGTQGHELVWAFEGRFADASMYETEVVICDEGGANFEAHWVPLDVFVRGEAPLYPDGLLEALTRAD